MESRSFQIDEIFQEVLREDQSKGRCLGPLLWVGQHIHFLVWSADRLPSSPVCELSEYGLALSLPMRGAFSSHCHREGTLDSQRKALARGHAAESQQQGFKVRDAQFQEDTSGLCLRNL